MASVAKWLRQRIVVPPLVGSSPIVRPVFSLLILISSPKGLNRETADQQRLPKN